MVRMADNNNNNKETILRKIAEMVVGIAKENVPSEERLKGMVKEFESVRSFMKYGDGSRSFDCTVSGNPVTLTHVDDGVRVELAGDSTVISPEDYDTYIDRLVDRYAGSGRLTVRKTATWMLGDIIRLGTLPDGRIFVPGGTISKSDAVRIAEIIDELTEDDENKEDNGNEHTA
jgi:hypothetical protein